MKTISPKVQDLLDQLAEMDHSEVREFRKLLTERFDLTDQIPSGDDEDGSAGCGVPRKPLPIGGIPMHLVIPKE